MTIIGALGDQMGLLVWGMISSYPFAITISDIATYKLYTLWFQGMINPFSTSQPLLWLFVSVFLSLFGASSYNVLLVLSILLTLIISGIFFRKYKFTWVYALIFTFSSYMWSHLGIHIPLIQLWLYPLLFIVLFNLVDNKNFVFKDVLKVSIVLSVAILISNYDGFILSIFAFLYMFSELLISAINRSNLKMKFYRLICVFTFVPIIVFIPLFSYIKANYISPTNSTDAYVGSTQVRRPLEDFVFFSSRPWYFFLPPVKNPFLGNMSSSIIENIKSTNYFLADDYFATEHSGNYFGIFLLATFFCLLYLVSKKKISLDKNEKFRVVSLLLTSVVILSFMMPPFFTLAGLRIYTPGYLLYKFSPMFRVTARFSPAILLSILTIISLLINKISFVPFRYLKAFMVVLLIVTLLETVIPPRVYKMNSVPEVYKFLNSQTPVGSIFAVYPYGQTRDAFFWISVHKRLLLNPNGFATKDFEAESFTKNLNTEEGIINLKKQGAKYLVVFKDAKEEDLLFFNSSELLKFNSEIGNAYLYTVL